jgi:hypothetical protein
MYVTFFYRNKQQQRLSQQTTQRRPESNAQPFLVFSSFKKEGYTGSATVVVGALINGNDREWTPCSKPPVIGTNTGTPNSQSFRQYG